MPVYEFEGRSPSIDPTAWIAPTAVVIGDVVLGPGSSVWFGAVLRGDQNRITVGAGTNVQDNAVLHVSREHPTTIGEEVTIGHGAVLEGCTVGSRALIGMGSTVMSRAGVGAGSIVAAGAVVMEGTDIPAGRLFAGVPARDRGEISAGAQDKWVGSASGHYRENAIRFREGLRPVG